MSQWMNLKIILTESSYYTNINPKPWLQVWALRALSNSFSQRQEFDFLQTVGWLTLPTVIYNNGSNQLSPVFHYLRQFMNIKTTVWFISVSSDARSQKLLSSITLFNNVKWKNNKRKNIKNSLLAKNCIALITKNSCFITVHMVQSISIHMAFEDSTRSIQPTSYKIQINGFLTEAKAWLWTKSK